jgi:hypothetical protein
VTAQPSGSSNDRSIPTPRGKRLGYTCYPRLIPGTISMAQIADAFHRTDLAAPTLHIQPEGNVTLVTLPTYVEVRWPTTGFQPGELDTLDPRHWFGMTVTIKPTLTSLTYDFGNGTGRRPRPPPPAGHTPPEISPRHTPTRAPSRSERTRSTPATSASTGRIGSKSRAPPRSRACPNPSW